MSGKDIVIVSNSRPKVYIVGGGLEYIRLMYDLRCDGATSVEDADVVLFTGGEDVDPALYDEPPHKRTNFNTQRDLKERAIYEQALARDLPMVGICRGGQFLNVMNGGKMWQHVTGHTQPHLAFIEVPPFNEHGQKRILQNVTSTHHQMMIPTDEAVVLLTALEAWEKENGKGYTKMGKELTEPDIEAVWYAGTSCLCFQPHPEYKTANAGLVDFFEECLENFVFPLVNNDTIEAIKKQADVKGKKKPALTVPKAKAK